MARSIPVLALVLVLACGEDSTRHYYQGDSDADTDTDTDTDADTDADSDSDTLTDTGAPELIWTDPGTGLTWQQAPEPRMLSWGWAGEYCVNLVFGGFDDWRLPTVNELRGLIRGTDDTGPLGRCGVTDACLTTSCDNGRCGGEPAMAGPGSAGCYWGSELGGACDKGTWSAALVEDNEENAWFVHFATGAVDNMEKDTTGCAIVKNQFTRCVRAPGP